MTTFELEKCLATLPLDLLPEGATIWPRFARQPMYWISDEPPEPDDWSRLRTLHPRSGLWPVFLHGDQPNPEYPWLDGELGLITKGSPEEYDAAMVIETLWAEHTEPAPGDGPLEVAQLHAETDPFGPHWPGLAPAARLRIPADQIAEDFAERLVNSTDTRLGLIPVSRGADVPAVTGWQGARQYLDPQALTAVLRSWEDRFGVRLVRLGASSMVLSVGAPPTTHEAALHVASEHFALCPDNFPCSPGALHGYAEELIELRHWSFGWNESPLSKW